MGVSDRAIWVLFLFASPDFDLMFAQFFTNRFFNRGFNTLCLQCLFECVIYQGLIAMLARHRFKVFNDGAIG